MPRYALVIRHREPNWDSVPRDRQKEIIAGYYRWTDDLRASGQYVDSVPLSDGGRTLRSAAVEPTDGPFTETKEIVGGFVLVETPDIAAAVDAARGCPALLIGDRIDVRPVAEHARPEGA